MLYCEECRPYWCPKTQPTAIATKANGLKCESCGSTMAHGLPIKLQGRPAEEYIPSEKGRLTWLGRPEFN